MLKFVNFSKVNVAKALLVAFAAVLLCSCSVCYANAEANPRHTMVLVSTQRLEALSQNNTMLLAKLEMLSQQVEILKLPSVELVMELAQSKAELTEVQSSLEDARLALKLSQQSLLNVESSLKRTSESLVKLEAQVQAERARSLAVQRRLRWQRSLGWLGGVLLGATIGVTVI